MAQAGFEEKVDHKHLTQREKSSPFGELTSPKAELAVSVPRKRTKIGCLTCRKRRIKCGEQRPVFENCIKSKRHCEGYVQRLIIRQTAYIGAHIAFKAELINISQETLRHDEHHNRPEIKPSDLSEQQPETIYGKKAASHIRSLSCNTTRGFVAGFLFERWIDPDSDPELEDAAKCGLRMHSDLVSWPGNPETSSQHSDLRFVDKSVREACSSMGKFEASFVVWAESQSDSRKEPWNPTRISSNKDGKALPTQLCTWQTSEITASSTRYKEGDISHALAWSTARSALMSVKSNKIMSLETKTNIEDDQTNLRKERSGTELGESGTPSPDTLTSGDTTGSGNMSDKRLDRDRKQDTSPSRNTRNVVSAVGSATTSLLKIASRPKPDDLGKTPESSAKWNLFVSEQNQTLIAVNGNSTTDVEYTSGNPIVKPEQSLGAETDMDLSDLLEKSKSMEDCLIEAATTLTDDQVSERTRLHTTLCSDSTQLTQMSEAQEAPSLSIAQAPDTISSLIDKKAGPCRRPSHIGSSEGSEPSALDASIHDHTPSSFQDSESSGDETDSTGAFLSRVRKEVFGNCGRDASEAQSDASLLLSESFDAQSAYSQADDEDVIESKIVSCAGYDTTPGPSSQLVRVTASQKRTNKRKRTDKSRKKDEHGSGDDDEQDGRLDPPGPDPSGSPDCSNEKWIPCPVKDCNHRSQFISKVIEHLPKHGFCYCKKCKRVQRRVDHNAEDCRPSCIFLHGNSRSPSPEGVSQQRHEHRGDPCTELENQKSDQRTQELWQWMRYCIYPDDDPVEQLLCPEIRARRRAQTGDLRDDGGQNLTRLVRTVESLQVQLQTSRRENDVLREQLQQLKDSHQQEETSRLRCVGQGDTAVVVFLAEQMRMSGHLDDSCRKLIEFSSPVAYGILFPNPSCNVPDHPSHTTTMQHSFDSDLRHGQQTANAGSYQQRGNESGEGRMNGASSLPQIPVQNGPPMNPPEYVPPSVDASNMLQMYLQNGQPMISQGSLPPGAVDQHNSQGASHSFSYQQGNQHAEPWQGDHRIQGTLNQGPPLVARPEPPFTPSNPVSGFFDLDCRDSLPVNEESPASSFHEGDNTWDPQ